MRIIGGTHSGRRIQAVPGSRTRPTGDRVREALFNIWQTRVAGSHLWDVYAGTGAIGLEALSRGAASVVLSESNRNALKTVRQNVGLLGVEDQAEVWAGTAEDFLSRAREQGRQFDLVFLDPPWADGVSEVLREGLERVLGPQAMAVVESRQDGLVPAFRGLGQLWTRRYGDTRLTAFSPEAHL